MAKLKVGFLVITTFFCLTLSSFSQDQEKMSCTVLACPLLERVRILEELKTAFFERYAGVKIKTLLIKSLDPQKIFNDCISNETQNFSSEDAIHAFLDRIALCVSPFQDSHIALIAPPDMSKENDGINYTTKPIIFAGIIARKFGKKFFITNVSSEIKNYVKNTLPQLDQPRFDVALSAGSEIIKVNGEEPEGVVAILAKYISRSSPASVRIEAERALFRRNFLLPQAATVQVEVRTKAGEITVLELPWWIANKSEENLPAYIKDKLSAFLKTAVLGNSNLNKDALVNDPEKVILFSESQIFQRNVYMSADKEKREVILQTGEVKFENNAACYLQILSFAHERVVLGQALLENEPADLNKEGKNFVLLIREFVSSCAEKKQTVIVDIRSNSGGIGTLALKTASVFRGLEMPGTSTLIFDLSVDASFEPATMDQFDFAMISNGLGKQFKDEKGAASAVSIDVSLKVLISSDCVSACSVFAALLEGRSHTKFIGNPTDSSWLGYNLVGNGSLLLKNVNYLWSDSLNVIQIGIPSSLTFKTDSISSKTTFSTKLTYEQLLNGIRENKPTQPDVMVDFGDDANLNFSKSWIDAIADDQ